MMISLSELALRYLGYHKYSFRPDWLSPSPYILSDVMLEKQGRSIKWYREAFLKRAQESKDRPPYGINVEGDFYQYKRASSLKRRILAIGDSGTFGQGVKRDEAWPKILENLNSNIEVMNFGVPGALLSDSLYYLRHFLLPYKPDVIIVCLFMANDINQSVYFDESLFNQALHLETLPSSWWRRSALYKTFKLAFIKDFKAKNDARDYEEAVFQRTVKEKTLFAGDFEQGEFLIYRDVPSDQVSKVYSNVEKLFHYFRLTAESIGAKLIFTAIPSRSYLEGRFNILPWNVSRLGQPQDYYKRFGVRNSDFRTLDFELPLKKVRTLLKEEGIRFYDFSSVLRSVNSGSPILINDDDHLNPYGHQELARLLNEELKK
jgi:lysophospholipase L1-like esterase